MIDRTAAHARVDEILNDHGGELKEIGYGLCDAVSVWSDCNRAVGHIFRVDDVDPQYRLPGETIRVFVPKSELSKLLDKVWADD